MDDKILKLYNALKADGYELPADVEVFRSTYQDTAKFQSLYQALKSDGYELPADHNELYKSYYGDVAPAPTEKTNAWEGAGIAAEAIDPTGLTKGAVDLGRTLYSGFTDQVPQMVENYTQQQIKNSQDSPVYGAINKGMQAIGLGKYTNTPEEFSKSTTDTAVNIERDVQKQKDEAAHKLTGVTQDFSEINSAASAASYIGSALGQAGTHIPASVLSGGGSSFLMESAIIYDQALDELSTKLGISREEIIKQGLDKQIDDNVMYSFAAAGLDALSAGSVLGTFKKAVTKEISKSGLKKFAKGFFMEGTTEAIQGNIEKLGATQAAGTEFKGDLKGTFNEFLAGGIGGGLSAFDNDSEKKTFAALQKDIDEETTGDPNLDQSIDAAAMNSAVFVEGVKETVDGMIPGAKAKDILKAAEDTIDELEEKLRVEGRARARAEILLGLNELPTAQSPEEQIAGMKNIPVQPGDATATAVVGDEGQMGLVEDQYLKPEESLIPEQITLPEHKKKKSRARQAAERSLPAAPSGVVQTPRSEETVAAEEKVEPYQAKDHTKDMFPPYVEEDKFKVFRDAEAAAEYGVVNEPDEIQIIPRFPVTGKPLIKKVKPSGEEPVIPKSVTRRGRKKAAPKEIVKEQVIAEPKAKVEVASKKEEEKQEKLENKLFDRIETSRKAFPGRRLSSLKKVIEIADKAGLKHISDEANKLWQETYDQMENKEEAKVLVETKRAKVLTKEERAAQKEEVKKAAEAKREAKKVDVKKGLVFKEDTRVDRNEATDRYITKIAQAIENSQTKGHPTERITALINEYLSWRNAYIKSKPDSKLKPLTAEEVRAKATRGDYPEKARKENLKDQRDRGNKIRAAKKLSAPNAKPLTAEQAKQVKAKDVVLWRNPRTGELQKETVKAVSDKGITIGNIIVPHTDLYAPPSKEEMAKFAEEKKAAQDVLAEEQEIKAKEKEKIDENVKKELGDILGVNPEDIGGVDFVAPGKKPISDLLDEAQGQLGLDKYQRKEITFDEFKATAVGYQKKLIEALWKVIGRYKGKEGSKTKFLELTAPEGVDPVVGGFHLSIANSDSSYIVIVKNSKGKILTAPSVGDVPAHELLHDYTKMMYHRLYKSDKKFAEEIQRVFVKIRNTAIERYEKAVSRILKETPTPEDMEVYLTALDLMSDKNKDDLDTALQTGKGVVAASVRMELGIYGLSNVEEMMAEAFSNPRFMIHLATIKLDEKITEGAHKGERKSLLYTWYNQLTAYVKKQLKDVYKKAEDYKTTTNALDYLMDVIAGYDEEFLSGQLSRKTNYDKSPFDSYNKNAEAEEQVWNTLSLAKVGKKSTVKKLNKEIVKNLFSTLYKRPNIKTMKDVQDYVDRVNRHLKLEKQLGDNYAPRIFTLIKNERALVEQAKITKENLLERAMDREQYYDNFKYETDVNDFYDVDIDKLNPSQRMKYISGFTKLANNMTLTQAEYDIMINFGKKEPAKDNLMPIAPKLHKTYFNGKKFGLEHLTNAALFSSIVAKFNSIVGDRFMENIYGSLMQGYSKAITESTDLTRGLNKIAEKYSLSHKDVTAVGIYGSIFSTVTDPDNTVEWIEEINENIEHAVDSAENKLLAFENKNYNGNLTKAEIEAEITAAKEIAEKLKKATKMDGILTKPQQEIYDMFRTFVEKHEDDFERNSVGVWGEKYVRRFNYFPTIAGGKVLGKFEAEDIQTIREQRNKDLFSAMDISGKSAQAKKARDNPKGHYYEFDAIAVAAKHSKSTLLDLYTSTEFKKLNRLLKDNEFRKALSAPLIESLTRHIKHISSSGEKYTLDNNIILKARDNVYTAAIATSGQFVLQAVSGIANAAVIVASLNPVKSTKNLAKALYAAGSVVRASATDSKTSAFYTFMKDNGLGIQIRDIFFETYFKSSEYQSKITHTVGKFSTFAQNTAEAPTRWGDKYAAATVWFAAYFDAGGTIEHPDPDAILRAERMVGVLQNMSDINFSAPVFRPNSSGWRHIMMMLYAFKSFALNSELSLLYSLKNSLTSPEARKIATAQLASVLTYRLVQGYVISLGYKYVAQMLVGGDDDDEKRYSWWSDIFYNAAWDMLIGGYSPAFVDNVFRYFFNKTEGLGMLRPDNGEEFDKYVDSPIYSARDANALYKTAFGPGTSDIMEAVVESADIIPTWMEEDVDFEKTEKNKEKQELYVLNLLGLFMAARSGMPLRGDAKRIMDKYIGKRKSNNFKESQGGGANSGGEGGEEEYVLPDGPTEDYVPEIENE